MSIQRKLLEEIKTPNEHKNDKRYRITIVGMNNVLIVWIEDQTSHNISLSQNLNQSNAFTFFSSMKAKVVMKNINLTLVEAVLRDLRESHL